MARRRKAKERHARGRFSTIHPDAAGMAESFLATLECALLARTILSTRAEAQAAIFEFIEVWYYAIRGAGILH